MSQKITGNTKSLSPAQWKAVEKLYRRKLDGDELISAELAREVSEVAEFLSRRVGLLLSREGKVEEVFLGTRQILYLPDLGRYRLGQGRFRRLRLVFSDMHKDQSQVHIPNDIYTDLEKLRLDAVIGVKLVGKQLLMSYAYLLPEMRDGKSTHTEEVRDFGRFDLNFNEFIDDLESEHARSSSSAEVVYNGALLVGVYAKNDANPDDSMLELKELARTAGVRILDSVIQRRNPDPKTLLGKGKLEEVVLHCLRLGAEILIFDTELRPSQWRVITNSTELKVLDRSMLILDIFAQRAQSSEGRLQVELAQLKYNLPRLVEKDAGLSRLSGGIGGRGPGETKLEIGRRRIRDKIALLEQQIDKLSEQRQLRRSKRVAREIPLISILGYTNVGKSTLFNALTSAKVLTEHKLFATLDPAQRQIELEVGKDEQQVPQYLPVVMADTVGFIRDLPKELFTAFRATLEEIRGASILLHVLDASDPAVDRRYAAVNQVLEEMELKDMPVITVLNKCDQITPEQKFALMQEYGALGVSAIKQEGLSELKLRIGKFFEDFQKSSNSLPVSTNTEDFLIDLSETEE